MARGSELTGLLRIPCQPAKLDMAVDGFEWREWQAVELHCELATLCRIATHVSARRQGLLADPSPFLISRRCNCGSLDAGSRDNRDHIGGSALPA
jgi:hypothetical protein